MTEVDIEVTSEMLDAGAQYLEKKCSGILAADCVAYEVLVVMLENSRQPLRVIDPLDRVDG